MKLLTYVYMYADRWTDGRTYVFDIVTAREKLVKLIKL